MLIHELKVAIETAPLGRLDDLSRDVWKALSNGLIGDDDAQAMAEVIHARKSAHRAQAQNPRRIAQDGPTAASKPGRSLSYFPPKKLPQRSPERRKSLQRRRTLAASGPMPPRLAAGFTTGELAVLRIVADEVRNKGTCELPLDAIAARAGVGLTKARAAIREAARQGLLTVEERRVMRAPNKPNLVRIVSREWLAWMTARSPRRGSKDLQSSAYPASQGGGSTFVKATDSKGFSVAGASPKATG